MELVEVEEHSPEHFRMMHEAAGMEPDGPEAKELKALHKKGDRRAFQK